jgi:hypothetical protein
LKIVLIPEFLAENLTTGRPGEKNAKRARI